MKKEIADKILAETELGYDFMSDKFSQTRKYFWRDLEFIGDYAKNGDNVFDFGCGNGRLLELFLGKNINYFGADISEKLIKSAKDKYSGENIHFSKINPSQNSLSNTKFTVPENRKEASFKKLSNNTATSDFGRNLVMDKAFNDNFFNAVYSIAVFHHFPGKEYREKMAKELYRITKPGGFIIITVWNLWPASLRQAVVSASRGGQKKYIKNIFKNWIAKLLLRSPLDFNDCFITFKNNQGEAFKRYHHAFKKQELADIFSKAGFFKEKIFCDRNVVYIGRK
jgi:ubiquinone/menaquinone biosynthesis C-methylase UbiE